jgi:hypothetical protein
MSRSPVSHGRSFLGAAALLAIGLAAAALASPAASAEKARVVLARNPRAVSARNAADLGETVRLFDKGLEALTGAGTPAEAWKTLGLLPSDVVAVKLNCNSWTISLNPHPELVEALCRSLQTVVPANAIILYDNDSGAVRRGGFAINRSGQGVRVTGTDQGDGFESGQRLTLLVTQTATKIINLASLKCVDEDDMIASLFLKNHIGSLTPGDMSRCHGDNDFLAGVCARPSLKNKSILNICDGLRGSYRRGVPWYWAGIVLGRDPVAAESACISVMNEKRALEKLRPLPIPEYLKIAESKYRLGTLDPLKIELVKIEI